MVRNNSDYEPRTYQDDLDTDVKAGDPVDPVSEELRDDPTEFLEVPPEEIKAEMDKLDVDDTDDDNRERVEDLDQEL